MERVTDLFPDTPARTRVWITEQGRKEYQSVPPELHDLFAASAEKGFWGYKGAALRNEGYGVWAYGTPTWTTRIAGFFQDDGTRKNFVVGGVWSGKCGRGNGRPRDGDTIAARVAMLKRHGVEYPKDVERTKSNPSDG